MLFIGKHKHEFIGEDASILVCDACDKLGIGKQSSLIFADLVDVALLGFYAAAQAAAAVVEPAHLVILREKDIRNSSHQQ